MQMKEFTLRGDVARARANVVLGGANAYLRLASFITIAPTYPTAVIAIAY